MFTHQSTTLCGINQVAAAVYISATSIIDPDVSFAEACLQGAYLQVTANVYASGLIEVCCSRAQQPAMPCHAFGGYTTYVVHKTRWPDSAVQCSCTEMAHANLIYSRAATQQHQQHSLHVLHLHAMQRHLYNTICSCAQRACAAAVALTRLVCGGQD